VSVHALVGVDELVNTSHKFTLQPTTHSKRKYNITTMSGSNDGAKLYSAAFHGKVEEVERLLKMGVKPEDWKTSVRRLCPPPLSVLRLQSPPPIATSLNPLSVGLNPSLSAFLSHPTHSPRALNLMGLRTGRHCSKVGGGLTVVGCSASQ
jgi:hypothetical protein